MPEIFRLEGYVFFFYANEGNEPMHVHVRRGGGYAKFWLEPLELDYAGSSLPFMLNQQTRCQDNILLTQKFRKFLKP